MKVKCPKCKSSDSVIPIMYGYPSIETWGKHDRGQIALGGCVIAEENPDYHCDECMYEWVKNKPGSGYYAQSDEE